MRNYQHKNRLIEIEEDFARFLEQYNMGHLPQAEQDRLWRAYEQGARRGREGRQPNSSPALSVCGTRQG